jgi:hypothetical protein
MPINRPETVQGATFQPFDVVSSGTVAIDRYSRLVIKLHRASRQYQYQRQNRFAKPTPIGQFGRQTVENKRLAAIVETASRIYAKPLKTKDLRRNRTPKPYTSSDGTA